MRYPLIDVLRAFAALLVLTFHVIGLGQWQAFSGSLWGWPFQQGWIGVDLFLVISGFVIALSVARERGKRPEAYRWEFMQRRLRRVVPLYALTCVLYIFLVRPELLMRPLMQLIGILVSHLLFLQNLAPYTHGAINGVTWSLALEMQFYVVIVLCIGFFVRMGAFRTLVLLIVAAWSWRYATTLILIPGVAVSHLQVIYTTQLPGMLDAFGVGIAMALLVLQEHGFWARRMVIGWKNCFMWLVICTGLMVSATAFFLQYGNYWASIGMVVFWRTLLAMAFGAALASVITCPLRGGGILRPVRYLGTISYGVYLWHFPIILALLSQPELRGGRLYVAVLLGSILLASMSWHWLEEPWVHAKNNIKNKIIL